MTPIAVENDGVICPSCHDTMTTEASNLIPVWSDEADDVICWSCDVINRQTKGN